MHVKEPRKNLERTLKEVAKWHPNFVFFFLCGSLHRKGLRSGSSCVARVWRSTVRRSLLPYLDLFASSFSIRATTVNLLRSFFSSSRRAARSS